MLCITIGDRIKMENFWTNCLVVIIGLLSCVAGDKEVQKPNILLVIADDLDVGLQSVERSLTATQKFFKKHGTIFENAFVTTPVCCPSRSSMLSGLYAHNHRALTNNADCNGEYWRTNIENKTIGVRMQKAGYHTAYLGKYLNNLDPTTVPPGWDRWFVQIGNSRYFDFTMLNKTKSGNIERVNYSGMRKSDYFTNVIQRDTLKLIEWANSTEGRKKPYFAVIGLPAPHGRADAIPEHQRKFANVKVPRNPNFNVRSSDKHWIMRFRQTLSDSELKMVDFSYRRRLQTLLSVDEFMSKLFKRLIKKNQLQNTYVFFTSDHGFHLGQFAQLKGKNQPYEDDIRVPLFATGPAVPKGGRVKEIVLNIDLAPTFLDIAKVQPRYVDMDGMSIMTLLKKLKLLKKRKVDRSSIPWRKSFLISKFKADQQFYTTTGFSVADWNTISAHGLVSTDPTSLESEQASLVEILDPSGKTMRRLAKYSFPRTRYSNVTITANTTLQLRAQNVAKLVRWMQRSKCRPILVCTLRYLSASGQQHITHDQVTAAFIPTAEPNVRARRSINDNEYKSLYSELEACNCTSAALRTACRSEESLGWICNQYSPCESQNLSESNLERQRCRRARDCSKTGIGCQLITTRHWKTRPYYNGPDICHCANTRNSSYWCERRIDDNHNYLYCKFVTGFEEYFDMRPNKDPWQLCNRKDYLAENSKVRKRLLHRLSHMRTCHGHRQCFTNQRHLTLLGVEKAWAPDGNFTCNVGS